MSSELARLRTRLRELEAARADLPPHSAQGWRDDLDDQLASLRRRIARAERAAERRGPDESTA